jgi:signal transduction histidine kinase
MDYLWFISEGKGKFYLDVNGKLVHYYTFENNDETGGVAGTLPYSRMVNSPGYTYAEGQLNVFQLHKKYFAELETLNPQLVQRLIGYMTERARSFATLKLQYEKVNALGQIAAGIAHELNNPSAAISRIASELSGIIKENYGLSQKLLTLKVNPEIIQHITDKANEYSSNKKLKFTAMQKIDMEDDITQWLVNNGIPEGIDGSGIFAESGFSKEELQNILDYTGKDSFVTVVRWLENYLTSLRIVKDLENSSSRISNLVSAIKNHVRMDRTNEMEKSNIHNDIEDSLTLLGHKLREKNITVKKNFCSNMREVQAYIGELNQVWTNLIDNAIYAMDKSGTLTIDTVCDKDLITVHITDDGHGIPAENLSRIFDPFFTTKSMGEGTGIGLDLVMRIVKKHEGEVKVKSAPGITVFTVKIPCK